MKNTHILVRPGELFLKGKNRSFFENKLINNIKIKSKIEQVQLIRGRFILPYFPEHAILRKIFGIVSYSPAKKVAKDIEDIKKAALQTIKEKEGTFKVETKRSDKNFPIKSPELNRLVGEHIEKNSLLTFKMETPNHILHIEINQKGTYLFTDITSCFGGMPTGIEGKVVLLVENEASILAGILMMKRGTTILPVSLTGNKELSLLNSFSPTKLNLKLFNTNEEIEKFAFDERIDILVTGQHLENFEKAKTQLVIFRPLIGYNKKEVKEQLSVFNFQQI